MSYAHILKDWDSDQIDAFGRLPKETQLLILGESSLAETGNGNGQTVETGNGKPAGFLTLPESKGNGRNGNADHLAEFRPVHLDNYVGLLPNRQGETAYFAGVKRPTDSKGRKRQGATRVNLALQAIDRLDVGESVSRDMSYCAYAPVLTGLTKQAFQSGKKNGNGHNPHVSRKGRVMSIWYVRGRRSKSGNVYNPAVLLIVLDYAANRWTITRMRLADMPKRLQTLWSPQFETAETETA